ncbi:unnamed protein product [Prorocentrum cordatum]|uniref:Uncharacterized protein n=1 Tax=Prorocentrum cordatum TaxID=2364126 RepID=A0ABN9P882_9DINO|nr:unnamed protein product [Polarella glacialis]
MAWRGAQTDAALARAPWRQHARGVGHRGDRPGGCLVSGGGDRARAAGCSGAAVASPQAIRQRAARLAMGEGPARTRPTAKPSSTPAASPPLAILDGSVAPPSPPLGDVGPCQQARMEKARISGGADSVASQVPGEAGLRAGVAGQGVGLKRVDWFELADTESTVSEGKPHDEALMDRYLEVKFAALGVVDAGSCFEELQVEASEFGTSGIVEGGSRCDCMLFRIVESEAGGMRLQSEGTREAEPPSKVGGLPKAVVEANQLSFQRVIGEEMSKQCEFAPSEVVDGGSCYKGRLGKENKFGTSEVVDAGSVYDEKLDKVNEFGTSEVVEESSRDGDKQVRVNEFAASATVRSALAGGLDSPRVLEVETVAGVKGLPGG